MPNAPYRRIFRTAASVFSQQKCVVQKRLPDHPTAFHLILNSEEVEITECIAVNNVVDLVYLRLYINVNLLDALNFRSDLCLFNELISVYL